MKLQLTAEQVQAFRKDPTVNPITRRKIKEGKEVYRRLQKACRAYEQELEEAIGLMQNLGIRDNEVIADNFTSQMYKQDSIQMQQETEPYISDAESTSL